MTTEQLEAVLAAPEPPVKWIFYHVAGEPQPRAAKVSPVYVAWKQRRNRWIRIRPIVGRQPIPVVARRAVLERDGMVCRLCQHRIVFRHEVHIDHIVPVSKGGLNTLVNLQVAHRRCNLRKGSRP